MSKPARTLVSTAALVVCLGLAALAAPASQAASLSFDGTTLSLALDSNAHARLSLSGSNLVIDAGAGFFVSPDNGATALGYGNSVQTATGALAGVVTLIVSGGQGTTLALDFDGGTVPPLAVHVVTTVESDLVSSGDLTLDGGVTFVGSPTTLDGGDIHLGPATLAAPQVDLIANGLGADIYLDGAIGSDGAGVRSLQIAGALLYVATTTSIDVVGSLDLGGIDAVLSGPFSVGTQGGDASFHFVDAFDGGSGARLSVDTRGSAGAAGDVVIGAVGPNVNLESVTVWCGDLDIGPANTTDNQTYRVRAMSASGTLGCTTGAGILTFEPLAPNLSVGVGSGAAGDVVFDDSVLQASDNFSITTFGGPDMTTTLSLAANGAMAIQYPVWFRAGGAGGKVDFSPGDLTTEGLLRVEAGGDFVAGAVTAKTEFMLAVGGKATQTAGIYAPTLRVLGPGELALAHADNQVGTLIPGGTGLVRLEQAAPLQLGTGGGAGSLVVNSATLAGPVQVVGNVNMAGTVSITGHGDGAHAHGVDIEARVTAQDAITIEGVGGTTLADDLGVAIGEEGAVFCNGNGHVTIKGTAGPASQGVHIAADGVAIQAKAGGIELRGSGTSGLPGVSIVSGQISNEFPGNLDVTSTSGRIQLGAGAVLGVANQAVPMNVSADGLEILDGAVLRGQGVLNIGPVSAGRDVIVGGQVEEDTDELRVDDHELHAISADFEQVLFAATRDVHVRSTLIMSTTLSLFAPNGGVWVDHDVIVAGAEHGIILSGRSVSLGGNLDTEGERIDLVGEVSVDADITISANAPVVVDGGLHVGTSAIEVVGALHLSDETTLSFVVSELTPEGHGSITATGEVDVSGADLTVAVGFEPAVGDKVTLIANDGAEAITGAFVDLPQGAAVAGEDGFVLSYIEDVNDLALVVPAPVNVGDDLVTVAEDHSADIDVLVNDGAGDLEVGTVSDPAHGTAERDEGHLAVHYAPDPDFNGSDSFTYQACTRLGVCASATVRVTVTPLNDVPVAVADTAEVAAGESVSVSVLGNDTDVDGDVLTLATVSDPGAAGTATIDGSDIVFTAAASASGTVTLAYTLRDAANVEAGASLVITVTAGTGEDVGPQPDPGAETSDVAETHTSSKDDGCATGTNLAGTWWLALTLLGVAALRARRGSSRGARARDLRR